MPSDLLIAWTTIEKLDQAQAFATNLLATKLVVCIQIDGPIQSHYFWDGSACWSSEYRIWIKFLPGNGADVERWLYANHPYQVPQWIVIPAAAVGGKYLSWVHETRTT